MTEEEFVRDAFLEGKIGPYLKNGFRSSLDYIGFPQDLVESLFISIENLKTEDFTKKYNEQLHKLHDIGFFQEHVPLFAKKYILPLVPSADRILDLGCGTGSLMRTMSQFGKFKHITGIDINSYPEWESLKSNKLKFCVVRENEFSDFIKSHKPDLVMITWVLHHMRYDEQERYLKHLSDALDTGTYVVILEDSYSTKLPPKNDQGVHAGFMALSDKDKKTVMSVYDWVANRLLARRKLIPIPFTYRTYEEWIKLFNEYKFKYALGSYIGFADHRDVNTPQSLLVFKKT